MLGGVDRYLPFQDEGLVTSAAAVAPAAAPAGSTHRLLLQAPSLPNGNVSLVSGATHSVGLDVISSSPNSSGSGSSSSDGTHQQSLVCTLVIAVILMVAFIGVHLVVNGVYRLLVFGELPTTLLFPCLDIQASPQFVTWPLKSIVR